MIPVEKISRLLRIAFRRQGLWFRVVLCWLLSIIILSNDEKSSYDLRFQARGDQKVSSQLVYITVNRNDISPSYLSLNNLASIKEVYDINDSFYWQKETWIKLLRTLIQQDAKKIAVSLYFPKTLGAYNLTSEERRLLQNNRIAWASLSSVENASTPLLSNETKSNLGTYEFVRDEDGVVRKFMWPSSRVPHLAERLTGIAYHDSGNQSRLINYRISPKKIPTLTMQEVLKPDFDARQIKGKYVIIGSEIEESSALQTPLGAMNRGQILYQVADNLLENRWIQRFPVGTYWSLLLIVVAISTFLIFHYPHSVAFVFLLVEAITITTLSAAVFDNSYFWIPIFSSIVAVTSTWIILTGYMTNKVEQKIWLIEQEQKYLHEIEQLKNNFVSLISHDLKTPIAKIQGVIDRLQSQINTGAELSLQKELHSLQVSNNDLNRYIQSILKLMRIEARDLKLNKEVGDINPMIEEVCRNLEPLAHGKQQKFILRLEPLFSFEYDQTLIREVLVNLIENAIKYSGENTLIQISSQEEDAFIVVSVRDHGPGIPKEELSKIWERFVRGRDQEHKTKGSGLGLYLVKYFVELHGGQVKIESDTNPGPSQGTAFKFYLPLEEPQQSVEHFENHLRNWQV